VLGVLFALLVVGAIVGMGGTGMATGGRHVRDRQLARRGLRYQWTVRVADVADGCQVKLEGACAPYEGELEAPFSHRRCVAYEVTVFDMDGVRPALLARLVVTRPFLLRDATGTAHVVPEPARVGILPDKQWRMEPKRHDRIVVELLGRQGVGSAAGPGARWRGRTLLVCEGVLAVGQAVAVYGHATREPDPEAVGLYRAMGTRPLVTGSEESPLLLAPAERG
jgi:hypothetical protein